MKRLLFIGTILLGLQANAQFATINENFEGFTTGTGAAWPQSGWSKINQGPLLYADGTSNKYIQSYSLFSPNVATYLITPQIVAPNGSTSIKFLAAQTAGSAGEGTIEVGLVPGTTSADMTSFASLGAAITLSNSTAQTYTFNVPASTSQYIAFRFVGKVNHAAIYIDDVVYASNLAVKEINASNDVKFVLNSDNTALQFFSKNHTVSEVQIYSASGQNVLSNKVSNGTLNVSSLKTGVYLINISTKEGAVVKSKFIIKK